MGHPSIGRAPELPPPCRLACRRGVGRWALVTSRMLLWAVLAGGALTSLPPVARAQTAAPATEGVVGEAPIAAGNVAAARERGLNEAHRQLVEGSFASLLAENGLQAPTPPLVNLRAGWLARPKRLVRNYRVLAQDEQNGVLQV